MLEEYKVQYSNDERWSVEGETLGDASAQKEFGILHEDIIALSEQVNFNLDKEVCMEILGIGCFDMRWNLLWQKCLEISI